MKWNLFQEKHPQEYEYLMQLIEKEGFDKVHEMFSREFQELLRYNIHPLKTRIEELLKQEEKEKEEDLEDPEEEGEVIYEDEEEEDDFYNAYEGPVSSLPEVNESFEKALDMIEGGEEKLGFEILLKSLDQDPENIKMWFLIWGLYQEFGFYDVSTFIKKLEKIIQRHPQKIDLLFSFCEILDEGAITSEEKYLFFTQKFQKYYPLLKKLIYQENSPSNLHRLFIFQKFFNDQDVFLTLDRLDILPIRDKDTLVDLAYTFLYQGKFKKCQSYIARIARIDPADPHIKKINDFMFYKNHYKNTNEILMDDFSASVKYDPQKVPSQLKNYPQYISYKKYPLHFRKNN